MSRERFVGRGVPRLGVVDATSATARGVVVADDSSVWSPHPREPWRRLLLPSPGRGRVAPAEPPRPTFEAALAGPIASPPSHISAPTAIPNESRLLEIRLARAGETCLAPTTAYHNDWPSFGITRLFSLFLVVLDCLVVLGCSWWVAPGGSPTASPTCVHCRAIQMAIQRATQRLRDRQWQAPPYARRGAIRPAVFLRRGEARAPRPVIIRQ